MAKDDAMMGIYYMIKAFGGIRCKTNCDECPMDEKVDVVGVQWRMCAVLAQLSAELSKE